MTAAHAFLRLVVLGLLVTVWPRVATAQDDDAQNDEAEYEYQYHHDSNGTLGTDDTPGNANAPYDSNTNDAKDARYRDDYDSFPSAGTVQNSLKQELGKPAYAFCNDGEYVLHVYERPLCPLAEDARANCPAFETACARPESEDRGEWGAGSLWNRGENSRGGARRASHGGKDEKKPEKKPEKRPEPIELPALFGGLMRMLFWLVIAVLVAVVIGLIANAWMKSARDRVEEDGPSDSDSDSPAGSNSKASVVESDVLRLLRRAKAAASEGRYGPAVDDVYAALLRYLEGEQLLVLERFRTNGDYVRALRQHPDWQRLVRECGRDVERSQFGKQEPDGNTFSRLLQRIEPVITRALALFVLVMISLTQVSCDKEEGEEQNPAKREWGPIGDPGADGLSMFVSLLKSTGYEVRHRVRRTADLDDETGLLIVYDDTSLEDEDWKRLAEWVSTGHELWIAGDDEAAKHFEGAVQQTPCLAPFELGDAYRGDRMITDDDGSVRPLKLSSVSGVVVEHSLYEAVFTCNGSPMVSQRIVGDGAVTLFADASLLTNASMVSADNAVAILGLVRAYPMSVEFAGGLAGAGAESPYEALLNAKLGIVLLQIALLMMVWYLSRGIPFATLRDPVEAGRRQFLDHLHALGRVFQRAGARQHALHHYASWALGKLNDRIRPGQRMSIIELGTALSKRTGRSQAEVMETLAEAAVARNQPDGQPTGDELKVLKRLEAFVIETGGAR